MKFTQGVDRDVLEMRSGGGALMIFGLPFLAAGIFVIGASLGLWMKKGAPPVFFALPFGGVFAAIGAAFVLGRRGVLVNVRDRNVVTWWGLLVPFRSTACALNQYDHVGLTREIRRSKNSTYTVYPVRLTGDEAKRISFGEPRNYKEARAGAEQLAKFVQLDLVDSSSGQAIRRGPNDLDESLREHAQRTRETIEMPDPPVSVRTKYDIAGTRITLELPPEGLGAQHVLLPMAVLGGVIMAIVVLAGGPLKRFFDAPPPAKYIAWGAALLTPLLLVGAALVTILSALRGHVRLVASRDGIQLCRCGVLFTSTTFIPSDELEELILPGTSAAAAQEEAIADADMPEAMKSVVTALARSRRGKKGIQARSDKVTVEFGKKLPEEELRWVHAVIMKMMTL